jgi:diguanylate cyclase (GGDEF)-like protein
MAVEGLAGSGGRAELAPEQLLRLLDTAVNPFALVDTDGTVLWAGSSISELLGVDAVGLTGRSMLEFLAPGSVDEALRALAAADGYLRSRSSGPDRWEGTGPLLDLVRADGTVITCAVAVATPRRTGLPGYAVQLRRATAAGALERTVAAMAGDRPIADVLSNLAEVLAGDLPGTDILIAHSPASGDEGGYLHVAGAGPEQLRDALLAPAAGAAPWHLAAARPDEVVEQAADELPAPLRELATAEGASSCAAIAVAVGVGEPATGVVVAWRRHDLPLHVFSNERLRRGARLVGLAMQWERGRRALEWAATHDHLTGLQNRQSFLSRLAGEARRRPPSASAVLYLDLDDFKPVNDWHGHALGDRVLAEVAARLRRSVRPTDVVARLGGDEFAVLCPGLDDHEVIEQLADRLVEEVGLPVVVDGTEVRVGLSVGIAGIVDRDGGPDEVLNRADDALRLAKAEGKRRWRRAT